MPFKSNYFDRFFYTLSDSIEEISFVNQSCLTHTNIHINHLKLQARTNELKVMQVFFLSLLGIFGSKLFFRQLLPMTMWTWSKVPISVLCTVACKPLNEITLGQVQTDNINPMIKITDSIHNFSRGRLIVSLWARPKLFPLTE